MEETHQREVGSAPPVDRAPLLSLRDLVATYGKRPVVSGVSLDVYPGERVALLGHNGAGKTTTLKCISGAHPMVSGSLTLDGSDLSGRSQAHVAKAGISTVPQGGGVFPTLTVSENLKVAAGIAGTRSDDGEVASVIRELFPILTERANQRAGSMSGGQRQMVAISMALMANPRVLLLDEPSTGLAPVLVTEVLDAIAEINDRLGIGMLIVEQNLREALRVSERVYVLQLGQIVFTGTADEFSTVDYAGLF
ncbi:MAG: ABC transporter ATP-binding protein [Actinomycetota bacterium]